ncbi:tRNA uridine(34) 5-carboxymethylaminomethyl modification radical SAM/GNAT enzyme Elp3 [Patescibacteria group bacterium]|nr:tRNA uridine(34) 5-carboxymethylaminomethyl modification radical SAM/GNAT enzyme Elp3 [Patescibacteria group bacterium]MBU4512710.1 tRNA uridine(34) 5-carboxymethylaminomethyl modification radical SAM/GNAT enzyme Elp3 [Patescibacteria group bacterium]MCG2688431.1 tRNA uridine(34) 5-carboxymethylaminomethyl modification radical SAM/GNAT enzyme Elp3 [Candidatus Parcubacteria bacterium]MCG2693171.1 tRNA uridine(34) 5-carboxymethylaminomethyl modification radical SAM/GNAT enzyme Elp3 [Candidatus 
MNITLEKFILKLARQKNLTRAILSSSKRRLAANFGISLPTNAELIQAYHKLLKKKKIVKNIQLERLLKKREIRTLSGVAPIAVLTKPYPCPGKCIYCPNEKDMPKSYLSNEPAVMRAILNKFDPYKQVQMRLRALEANGHPTDKCELIVMGGTWSCLPMVYQTNFIKRCFQAFNEFGKKTRKQENKKQETRLRNSYPFVKNSLPFVLKKNEKAKHRVVGLTLETRPDYITQEEILRMRSLGCTRIEIGVQSIYDDILKLNKRGCTRQQIIDATRLLKDAGFKITYHLMPNLPGATPARDFKMFKELFSDPAFQPDQLKIYPCVITRDAKIYSWLKSKKYKPYSEKQLTNLLINIKKNIPPYVRITRLIRDIPSESIIAGNKISNLRQIIQQKMQATAQTTQSNTKSKKCIRDPLPSVSNPRQSVSVCQCIRCREIRGSDYKMKDVKLIKREYQASQGKEIFLSYEDVKQDKVIAFLRLRLPQLLNYSITQLPTLKNAAIIREVHTYGTMIPVGQLGKVQHRGFGKKLMAEAEKIVKNFEPGRKAKKAGYKKIAVISGIGVRDYYRKLGYNLENEYMVKSF